MIPLICQQFLARGPGLRRGGLAWGRGGSPLRTRRGGSVELCDDVDRPHDVVVELLQILGRNPVLLVNPGADSVDLIAVEEGPAYVEAGDVSPVTGTGVFGIPVSRDLHRILLIQHGIEDRLPMQARRPPLEAALPNQPEFGGACRSEEGDNIVHDRPRVPSAAAQARARSVSSERWAHLGVFCGIGAWTLPPTTSLAPWSSRAAKGRHGRLAGGGASARPGSQAVLSATGSVDSGSEVEEFHRDIHQGPSHMDTTHQPRAVYEDVDANVPSVLRLDGRGLRRSSRWHEVLDHPTL